jgi:hypothetical protein
VSLWAEVNTVDAVSGCQLADIKELGPCRFGNRLSIGGKRLRFLDSAGEPLGAPFREQISQQGWSK